MTAIALALASSLAYGISDFLGGLRSRSLPLISVLLVSQVAALVAVAIVAGAVRPDLPAADLVLLAVAAGVCELVGIAALYRGLSGTAMSNTAASAALAPVVPLIAAALLGEMPSLAQGVGLALAFAGIVALVGFVDGVGGDAAGFGWGLLAAAGIGGYMLAIDGAAEGGVLITLLLTRTTTVLLLAGLIAVVRPRIELTAADVRALTLVGLLMLAADSLYAAATTEGLLSVVSVLGSLYPVVTILLARAVLGERLNAAQVAAMAVIFAGVAAVAAG